MSERDFLKLLYEDILHNGTNNGFNATKEISQSSLNIKADEYLKKHPTQDVLYNFVKENIKIEYGPKKWGWGMNLGFTYGIPVGNLHCYVRNFFGANFSVDILYKKFALSFDAVMTTGNAKQEYSIKGISLYPGESTNISNIGMLFSYGLIEKSIFRVQPFIGPVWSTMTFPIDEYRPELENLETPFYFNGALGVRIDVDPFRKYYGSNGQITDFPIYFRYYYNFPQLNRANSRLSGGMHFLTLGMGLRFRGIKRVYSTER